MLKNILIFIFLISTVWADNGSLRIIVDYGQKENISIKPCNQSTLDDFIFISDNFKNKRTSDSAEISFNTDFYMCIPPYIKKNNINYDFEPTIIMFNDSGLKGVPTLFNRKLVSSSSINKLLYNFLLKNNNTISLTQSTLKEISKFDPKNFYFAITPDIYDKLNTHDNIIKFTKNYFESIKDNLIKEKTGKKDIIKKLDIIKNLVYLNLEIYIKMQTHYNTKLNLLKYKKVQVYPTGLYNYCKDLNNNISCKSCLEHRSPTLNSKDCVNECQDQLAYKQCKSKIGDNKYITIDDCLAFNCLNESTIPNSLFSQYQAQFDNENEHDYNNGFSRWTWSNKTGKQFTDIMTDSDKINHTLNFQYETPDEFQKLIAKKPDGSVDDIQTKQKQEAACREKRETNVEQMFQEFSSKLNQQILFGTINNVDMDTINKAFNYITLDTHKVVLTNDIKSLISNPNCLDGITSTKLNSVINILNYTNTFKLVDNEFIPYSSKLLGKNMNSGFNEFTSTGTYPAGNSTVSGGVEDEKEGSFEENTNNPPKTDTNKICGTDESIFVLFWNNLDSNDKINKTAINNELNSKLGTSLIDVGSYNTYLACYKNSDNKTGYITKWIGQYNRSSSFNKEKALKCFNSWEAEADSSNSSTSPYHLCLDHFIDNLNNKGLIDYIYSKMSDKDNNDKVVLGSLLHSKLYHESTNDYIQNNNDLKPLFLNNLNSVKYNSYNLTYNPFEEISNCKEIIAPTPAVDATPEIPATSTTPAVPATEGHPFIKGTIECTKFESLEKIQKHTYTYDYTKADLISSINSYKAINLSDLVRNFQDGNDILTLSKSNPQYYINFQDKSETKKCNVMYQDISTMNEQSYINDMIDCFVNTNKGEDISDYQANQTYIKGLFPNLYNNIINNLNSINMTTGNLTEDEIFNYYLDKSGIYYYNDLFKINNAGYTPNDMTYYQIELKDINLFIDQLKN